MQSWKCFKKYVSSKKAVEKDERKEKPMNCECKFIEGVVVFMCDEHITEMHKDGLSLNRDTKEYRNDNFKSKKRENIP